MTACAVEIGLAHYRRDQEAQEMAYEREYADKEREANHLLEAWASDTKAIDSEIGEQCPGGAWDDMLEAMQAAAEACNFSHPEERRMAAKVAGDKLVAAMEKLAWVAVGCDKL